MAAGDRLHLSSAACLRSSLLEGELEFRAITAAQKKLVAAMAGIIFLKLICEYQDCLKHDLSIPACELEAT